MEYLIAALLIVVCGLIIWVAVKVGVKKDDGSDVTINAIQTLKAETEFLRRELGETLTKHISIVDEQLARNTAQVTAQLNAVTGQLQTSTGQLNNRMDNAARAVGELNKELGELGKATEQVFSVGKDIADLQNILKAPKLRGEIGEFFLADLLAQILPKANFELQYGFKSGTRVDAIIKLEQGIVPVDSKFPLDNFKRIIDTQDEKEKQTAKRKFIKDVKLRIDEIADSYIVPDEGTFNFALMYIPAENVYYETIIKDEFSSDGDTLSAYAFSKRVVPVSPNSFYAYLQTILLGLRGLEISKHVQSVLARLETLQNDFGRFTEDFEVIGKHLGNARGKYEEATKKIDRFGEKLTAITEGADGSASEDPVKEIKSNSQRSLLK